MLRIKPLSLDLPPSHTPDANTDFQTAVQTLWSLDSNRLKPHSDYAMDVQNSKHPCNKEDVAGEPLFTFVNPQVFSTRPTYKSFKALLDNYSAYTGEEEKVSDKELRENQDFLDVVMQTAVMKYCHQYCVAKGVSYNGNDVPESQEGFKNVLNSIWFELYSRSGGGRRRNLDSSGFEHGELDITVVGTETELKRHSVVHIYLSVFVGEVKNGQISGFHNWIQFYLEEKAGNVDYRGYIKPRSRDSTAETNEDDPVLTLQFSWNGVEKFVGTSFIGKNM
jgi:poly(U)-specific endoribonuclease